MSHSTLRQPILLTPGPLNTTATVKEAMLHDWGSREQAFINLTASIRERLLKIAGAEKTHTAIPLQGSGTFAVEAMIGTLLPQKGKLLVLVNGAYGKRMVRITEMMRRAVISVEGPEEQPVDLAKLDQVLTSDAAITHVAIVHCETTSGILNPIKEVAALTARHKRRLFIDAMSSFGALPLDAKEIQFDALATSSNKCLQGVPGVSFVVAREDVLSASAGNAHSLSLDLYQQWKGFADNGQWRFTPPTHVLAALSAALNEHAAEGGVDGRGARYRKNCHILIDGMRALGFKTFLDDKHQAPIIATFLLPTDSTFSFDTFYKRLYEKGFVIYPGKLTIAPSFRIGCIGDLDEKDMHATLIAVNDVLDLMKKGA